MEFGIFCHGTPIPWVLVQPRHLQWCSLCDPVKKNSHPSLVIYFFATPPIKLKLGQEKGCGGTTNSKPPGVINHYDGPFRKNRPAVRSYLRNSFLQIRTVAGPFTEPPKTVQLCWAKTNLPELKPTCFHFSSSNFTVQDQVLNPAGDGLKHTSQAENFTFQITEIVQKEKVTFFGKKL